MDYHEFAAWSAYMRTRRGKWTVDPVHNGQNGMDLMLFCPAMSDATCGVYILGTGCTVTAGIYHSAEPHMGEAEFQTMWGMSLLTQRHARTSRQPTEDVLRMMQARMG